MSKYSDLEVPALMDLLVSYTMQYTKMSTYQVFSVEEFSHCKQQLAEIQATILEKTGRNKNAHNKNFPNYPGNLNNPGSNPNRS